VVKVLEAVALLLQFRLFVVVVAVDARWLEGALRSFYAAQFAEGQAGPGDYLEKIFQVPFWLPRLAAGKAFQGLARTLMPEGAAEAKAQQPAVPHVEAAPESADVSYALDPDEVAQPGDEAPAEARAAVVERVTLTPAEVEVLTALMPLAATGPRGAKRFVNLYRLARARRNGEELRRFLGEDGESPEFPALGFAIALACGATSNQWAEIERFYRKAPEIPPYAEVEPQCVVAWMNDVVDPDEPGERLGEVPSFPWDRWGAMGNTPASLKSLTHSHVASALAEASRYSFHPPTLDRAPSPANPAAEQPGSTA
jgi:hypothetical protein